MTKRKEQALKTRQKILDAAYDLLSKNEFDNLNIDDITNACGVAKGTFYTYFNHKEDVVFEICRPFFAQIENRMQKMKNKNIIERLCYYFDEFMKEVQRYGVNITRAWFKGVIDPNKAPENYDSKKWQYDVNMLQNILNTAVHNRELREDTPVELLTHLIITQLYGMMTVWCMSDCEFDPKFWTKTFSQIQLNAILKNYLV
ncbi:TetR/AcrR family transcriptional regulator [bacterium]|nr:TetR/AcrR family transcriptional regulator [bacterium]